MNIYLVIILAAIIGEFVLGTVTRYLNLKRLDPRLPDEFKNIYDEKEYSRSQEYTRSNTYFGFVASTFDTALILAFILLGGFNWFDLFVRGYELGPVLSGLLFFSILMVLQDLISMPFSLYGIFVIEEKFGFNKTTARTYVIDKIKSYLVSAVIGFPSIAVILFFFGSAGEYAWFYAWGFVVLFILAAQPLFITVIAPLFNKYSPLEEGELKTAIDEYAGKTGFPLKEISVMDGSRRSLHSNAYFSGIGKKRIALYDTLVEKHAVDELVAIIAHEVGHYKLRHIYKNILIAIVHTGVLFYVLSLFIDNRGLFDAFGMEHISVYGGLVFFSLLFSPIEMLLSILMNIYYRNREREADEFAAETTGSPESMIRALKNLTVSNLGNLTPHPLVVFLSYSHPPVLSRINHIRSLQKQSSVFPA